jgi:hypothetical protein
MITKEAFASSETWRKKRRAVIDDFIAYVNQPGNEDVRFWQAVRNFSKFHFIYGSNYQLESVGNILIAGAQVDPRDMDEAEKKGILHTVLKDTFHMEDK